MNTETRKFIKLTELILLLLVAGACRLFTPTSAPPLPDTAGIPSQIQTSPTPLLTSTPYISMTPRSSSLSPDISQTPQPTNTLIAKEQITRFRPGQEVTIKRIDMKDESTGWAIGFLHHPGASQTDTEDHILRTTDGGRTWLDITPPELTAGPNEYGNRVRAAGFFLDENTAWVSFVNHDDTFNFRVWRTTNGGNTWEQGELILEGEIWDMVLDWEFIDANQGWAMLGGGVATGSQPAMLVHTNDGGANWEVYFNGGDGPLYSGYKTGIRFLDAQTGLITRWDASYKPSLSWTRDGGRTWESQYTIPLEAPLPYPDNYICGTSLPHLFSPSSAAFVMKCSYRDQADVYRVKTYLFYTRNSGESWPFLTSPQEILNYLQTQTGFTLTNGLLNIPDTLQIDKMVSLVWNQPVNYYGAYIHFISEQLGWMVGAPYSEENDPESSSLSLTTDGGITWQPLEPKIAAPDS